MFVNEQIYLLPIKLFPLRCLPRISSSSPGLPLPPRSARSSSPARPCPMQASTGSKWAGDCRSCRSGSLWDTCPPIQLPFLSLVTKPHLSWVRPFTILQTNFLKHRQTMPHPFKGRQRPHLLSEASRLLYPRPFSGFTPPPTAQGSCGPCPDIPHRAILRCPRLSQDQQYSAQASEGLRAQPCSLSFQEEGPEAGTRLAYGDSVSSRGRNSRCLLLPWSDPWASKNGRKQPWAPSTSSGLPPSGLAKGCGVPLGPPSLSPWPFSHLPNASFLFLPPAGLM